MCRERTLASIRSSIEKRIMPYAWKPLFIAGSFAMATLAAAFEPQEASFTTLDGKVFDKVTVTRTVGRKLEIRADGLTQLVTFKLLPKEIQVRFFPPSMLHPPNPGSVLTFKSVDGRNIQGTLIGITPDGITIETEVGVEKFSWLNLPPELANTFDYDFEDAARYRNAMQAEARRAVEVRQAAEAKEAAAQAKEKRSNSHSTSSGSRSAPSGPAPLGQRGTQSLGAPKLGGSGLGK